MILEDPFPTSELLSVPPSSPAPIYDPLDYEIFQEEEEREKQLGTRSEQEIESSLREKEAKSKAVVLEMIGDLPDADIAPPDNILFICKLNPITRDEDLNLIFSRFGKIIKCEIIRDWKTDVSLQYAFIEFEKPEQCEQAYFKMDNVTE
jgi:peptidyl-prolyl cis-trans isomerase-like 4